MSEIKLTREQQEVVTNRGGTLLVSAAAGSGKTKVLLDRVLKRVEDDQCNVDNFLMITFTKAAAAELRGKLVEELSKRLAIHPENHHLQKQMNRVYLAQISTVHAFCASLLRDYAHVLDLPGDFRICDDQEAQMMSQRAMDRVLEEAYARGKDREEIRQALNLFSGERNREELPDLIKRLYEGIQCYRDPELRLRQLHDSLNLSDCRDIGDTIWGKSLIGEFHTKLDQYLQELDFALKLMEGQESLEKFSLYCLETREILLRLKQAKTWDEIRSVSLKQSRAPSLKSDPLNDRVKSIRKDIMENVKQQMEEIFNQTAESALQDVAFNVPGLHGLLLLTESYGVQYQKEKTYRHTVDYSDLEHLTLKLLLGNGDCPTPAAREISKRFVELMVDEYQDTNEVQDAIFRAISKEGQNLFFVGDVKQSIYGFRKADPRIFLEKYKAFPDYDKAREGQPRRILLSNNFRSRPEILDAANEVFRLCMTERVGGLEYGEGEALRPNLPAPDMGEAAVEFHCMDTAQPQGTKNYSAQELEAEFVARRIEKMLKNQEKIPGKDGLRAIRPEDIVILMRNLGGKEPKAPIYMKALQRRGIQCAYGSENIFETEEVGILRAMLEIIDNPHQDIPLLTVLLSPLCCFDANDLALGRARDRNCDLVDTLTACPGGVEFLGLLQELRDFAQRGTLRSLLDLLDEKLFFRSIFGAMEKGEQRLANLDRFCALADAYEGGDRYGLPGFLQHLQRLEAKGVSNEDMPAAGVVRIMTIHTSKGLQFPVVFLPGLWVKFNEQDASAQVLFHTDLGIAAKFNDWENKLTYPTASSSALVQEMKKQLKSEEMRVLYVAMTRAQHRLIMSCCDKYLINKLGHIAQLLTEPAMEGLIEDAKCMGHWVAMAAMTHTEAGALFQVAGYPIERKTSDYPWKITWNSGADYLPAETEAPAQAREDATENWIEFVPGERLHALAEQTPSKLTATQLKGRNLDSEISQETAQRPLIHFRKPRFGESRKLNPTERGTAIHLAMQYLRYEVCTDLPSVERELDRLEEEKFMTKEQREAVPPIKILRFFRSDLGQRVLHAKKLVREFKFSILEDGSILQPELAGEQILLQGVTDCGILEEDGLTIIDFKSDRVTEETEQERAEYYRGQLDAYSRALAKVFQCPVKERILYFFATDHSVCVLP